MYKCNVNIEQINKSIKIKVGMILKSEENKFYNQKLINKFNYFENDYLNLSPKAFVTIDLASAVDKDDKYSPNRYVNLNKIDLIRFCAGLNRLISKYKTELDLFYTENGKLMVNHQKSNRISETIRTSGHKVIQLIPCVVIDEDNNAILYEGCVMYINSFDNYAYMTYDEMIFMYAILSKMDLTTIGLQILSIYLQTKDMESEKLESKKNPITEEIEIQPHETSKFAVMQKPNKIPDI